jgi:predicted RNase H-like HicB family nuclease
VTYFVGILDGSGSVWGVSVPDMPGCHGGGSSPDAAIADAIQAMSAWAQHAVTSGHDVPVARSVVDVIADLDVAFDPTLGEATVMLPLVLEVGRAVRANISLDAGTLEAIDAEAKRIGLTRSAFMASAALDKIARVG